MTREQFLGCLLGVAVLPVAGCEAAIEPDPELDEGERPELFKTRAEWRALLPPAAYAVLFEEATEPAGSSPLDHEYNEGIYVCAACFIPLFPSTAKYDSRTGWPSFWRPIDDGRLGFKQDNTLSLPRIEYHCKRCGGHQGHVFDDGPAPTGKRYCNNGLALQFYIEGTTPPDPRT